MLRRVIPVVFVLLLACAPVRARDDAASVLLAADAARSAAMVTADVATLGRLLGDDLTYVHSTGAVDTKARLIERLREHELRYVSITRQESQVRLYGTTGVIVGIAQLQVEKGGDARAMTLRYSATYLHRDGRWQLVAYQSTAIQ